MATISPFDIAQAELDCRAFAQQWPGAATEAVALCEAGLLSWLDVAALFARSAAKAIDAVA